MLGSNIFGSIGWNKIKPVFAGSSYTVAEAQASKPGKQGHSTYLLHETRHPFSHHQLDDRLFRPKQLVHSVLHGLDQFSVYLHDQVSGLCARRQYLHMHRFEERREKGRGRARRGKGTYGNQATPCCRAVGGQF